MFYCKMFCTNIPLRGNLELHKNKQATNKLLKNTTTTFTDNSYKLLSFLILILHMTFYRRGGANPSESCSLTSLVEVLVFNSIRHFLYLKL